MKLCKLCGKEFDGKGVYCSDECRYQAKILHNRDRRRRKRGAIHCQLCGKIFTPTPHLKKYCSEECAKVSVNRKTTKKKEPKLVLPMDRKSPIMDKFKKRHKVYEPIKGDSYNNHMERQMAKTLELCGKVKV